MRILLRVVDFTMLDPALVAVAGPGESPWRAILAVEGTETGDGRFIEPNALTWRDLPLSLGYQNATPDGYNPHGGAVAAGRIESIERDGALIRAEGAFTGDNDGRMAAQAVRDQKVRGVSVELELVDSRYEQEIDATTGAIVSERYVVMAGQIMSAIVAMTAAFADATIEADAEIAATEEAPALAAAGDIAAPRAYFDDPALDALTPLTLAPADAHGFVRVYGHIAAHAQCHIGMPWTCETPPESLSDYAYFQTGQMFTDAGPLAVGRLTFDGLHASDRLDWRGAQRHYEDVSMTAADVRAGSDAFGIWISGVMRRDLSDEQLLAFANASPSGDWRDVRRDGSLELVGVHQVCTGGFLVPRLVASATMQDGAVRVLVASGVPRQPSLCDDEPPQGMLLPDGVPPGALTYTAAEQIMGLRREIASLTSMVSAMLRFGVNVPEHL